MLFTKVVRFAVLNSLGLSMILAQNPAPTTRDFCVKVQPGKGAEYEAMLHDVAAKLAQVTVDQGTASWWLAARAVVPAGSAARCDYHVVYGYPGFPPEGPPTAAQMDADLQKANIKMTGAELSAKRGSLSTLANVDIWRSVARVGQPQKGSYIRVNLYKPKLGQLNEWAKLETEGWKPLAEAHAKDSPGSGWVASALLMPGGDGLHYNAMTVDIFPNWAAVGKGVPVSTLWPKVHADMPFADYMSHMATAVDRYRIELYQVVEMVPQRK